MRRSIYARIDSFVGRVDERAIAQRENFRPRAIEYYQAHSKYNLYNKLAKTYEFLIRTLNRYANSIETLRALCPIAAFNATVQSDIVASF